MTVYASLVHPDVAVSPYTYKCSVSAGHCTPGLAIRAWCPGDHTQVFCVCGTLYKCSVSAGHCTPGLAIRAWCPGGPHTSVLCLRDTVPQGWLSGHDVPGSAGPHTSVLCLRDTVPQGWLSGHDVRGTTHKCSVSAGHCTPGLAIRAWCPGGPHTSVLCLRDTVPQGWLFPRVDFTVNAPPCKI